MTLPSERKQSLLKRIEQIQSLPALPEVAQRVLALQQQADAETKTLAEIIELDPALASQLLRHASAPFFGRQRKLTSMIDAIAVLGFDRAMNLAVGLSTSQAFNVPLDGPVGLRSSWRHALYSATLMQTLTPHVMEQFRPDMGLAYLSALLHNIGHLLLAHTFPEEFNNLNQTWEKHPSISLLATEKNILLAEHPEIGAALMRHWLLPAEVLVGIFEHHNPHYRGDHASYPNLLYITNCVLKRQGIGDSDTDTPPLKLMESLGLAEEDLTESMDILLKHQPELDALVVSLRPAVI
ncbi:MAG: HDOD domain-containing protein [Gammaproteobacteria bacterium]|nr:HDOD domain-containing protein [Gammaproteobacteria bacterium]MDH5691548.1 HDOD domain-containing protein [Gammaproteobacteria bacterium]